jgi:hypothetical protein
MVAVAVVTQSGDAFSPMDPDGMEFFYWDFTKELKPGESVTSAAVVAISTVDGSDNSAAMVNGAAVIMNGMVVRQMIAGASTPGVTYRLTAKGTTNLGQVLPLSGLLTIGPEFGVVT